MTYLEDLSPCAYLDRTADLGLVSIGWLSRDHPFSSGRVDEGVRAQLERLLDDPYCPVTYFGWHLCEFCRPATANPWDLSYPNGLANLLVPGDGVIFACPELIAHCIDVHGYHPPDVFLTAVSACPPLDSEAYFTRLIEIGGSRWVDTLRAEVRLFANERDAPFASDVERGDMRRRAAHMRSALQRLGLA